MNDSPTVISWCPQGVGTRDQQGNITFTPLESEQTDSHSHTIPQLPENIDAVDCVYFPMEALLTRHFVFPLKHTRYLDKDMLLQDLTDTAGIVEDDWWLTWSAHETEHGIAGLVFGLHKELQQSIQGNNAWESSPLFLVDGWQRLNQWLKGTVNIDNIAVIDADAEGIFLGFYQAGIWQGMRRLNVSMDDDAAQENVAKQTLWSLQAMGFDAETMPVTGRITPELTALFPQTLEALPLETESSLAPRHILNLALPKPSTDDKTTLNIRHGSWAVRNTSSALKSWHRPALLAACLCFLWLSSTVVSNYQLESQLQAHQDEIITAFHRGLPEQPVIIDALAQLRQAAGGDNTASQSPLTEQLFNISKVFEKTPWKMKELSINKGSTTLAGTVESLGILNNIRDALAELNSSDVQIADTDLDGDKVSFRMRW